MKKKAARFILFIFFVTACGTTENGMEQSPQISKSSSTLQVKGLSDVDIVNTHGSVEGIERMEEFYDHMQNGQEDKIRMVQYTIEGDPMVKDILYNGKELTVIDDTTRDQYGSGDIYKSSCQSFVKEENNTSLTYLLTGCNPKEGHSVNGIQPVLTVEYDMSMQDKFEIELRYGQDLSNNVSTISNEKTEILPGGETATESDFDLSDSAMQEVYKRLVLANYLGEFSFEQTCHVEDVAQYFLAVEINGAKRSFTWKACGDDKKTRDFTDIADYIIEQSKMDKEVVTPIPFEGYVLDIEDSQILVGLNLNLFDYELVKSAMKQGEDLENFTFQFVYIDGESIQDVQIGDKVVGTRKDQNSVKSMGGMEVEDVRRDRDLVPSS